LAQSCTISPLLADSVKRPDRAAPNPEVMVDLVEMAYHYNASNILSSQLHSLLAGHLGKPGAVQLLLGLQEVIFRGEAAGARLLAAFLAVTTPGARLIPRIQKFSSSRRYHLMLQADDRPANPFASDWLRKSEQVSRETEDLLMILGQEPTYTQTIPGKEAPWPAWRLCFLKFLEDIVAGRSLMPDARKLMADLIRMETDAWQERTSNLAGTVNPSTTAAVPRVLPIIRVADSQVQDLRQLISWIEAGDDQAAFTNQVSCALDVMDERDHGRLRSLINETPSLANLALLSKGLYANPLELPRLVKGASALMALGGQLKAAELREEELGLFQAVCLIQENLSEGLVKIPVGSQLAGQIKIILSNPARLESRSLWPLDDIQIRGDFIQIPLAGGRYNDSWENFLPSVSEEHPRALDSTLADEDRTEEASEDLTGAAIKHLVMSNIMSTSVILGFLRNPKVIGIPGLVGDVAARTRNPQIIETIATDRTLYTGFANREVARICLLSPCNVSVKTLRKFIHVKYVSKIDLKRMSQDTAGMRREVVREITKYLKALA